MFFHHKHGVGNANITEMPRFICNMCHRFFVLFIALNKAILICYVSKVLTNTYMWKLWAYKINMI